MTIVDSKFTGYNSAGEALWFYKIRGKSTETKPTKGVADGSEFFCFNNGTTLYFDGTAAAGSEWAAPETPAAET